MKSALLRVIVAGFMFILIGCDKDESISSQSALMLNEKLQCPEGSVAELRRWGGVDQNGWSHSCKMKHGKYHVWNGDILIIEGEFKYGQKIGDWTYRDSEGNVTDVETFDELPVDSQ